jgi:hypothetical protein
LWFLELNLLSDEHFTVDGTLIEAAASLKSFRPKDEPPTDGSGGSGDIPANRWVDFHGEKRSNATHQSRTDPDARRYKRSAGQAARLCYVGHVLWNQKSTELSPGVLHSYRGFIRCHQES